MEPDKGEESGEMYSLDEQGEYVPEESAVHFSVQGLTDRYQSQTEYQGQTIPALTSSELESAM